MRSIAGRAALMLAAPLCASVGLPQVTWAEESARAIEEVLVTARYREEAAQESPTAITAFNQTMLENITAQDLRDVGPQSPNVRIQANTFAPNSSTIHMRGLGSHHRIHQRVAQRSIG